jgi:hypothetical protein
MHYDYTLLTLDHHCTSQKKARVNKIIGKNTMITDSKHVPNKIIRFISFDHIKLYTEFVTNDLRAGLYRVQGRQLFRNIRSCLGL